MRNTSTPRHRGDLSRLYQRGWDAFLTGRHEKRYNTPSHQATAGHWETTLEGNG
ncbi:hypothetical protein [Phormidium sp. CCY1219]|uniref:hypothetical protein n=1 Tax=Phormidium sp. CCY1219 TaxID=2886104 RepID=UPI002D7794A3|nr:hypothetical protein [Phormidium sp. CCY1219]